MSKDAKFSMPIGQAWLSDRMSDVQPRSFQRLLGLRSELLADRLLKNRNIKQLLSRDLCQKLELRGGALSTVSVKDMRVIKKLVWLPSEEITSITRVIALLLNRQKAMSVTSGAAMAEIFDWAQSVNVLPLLRGGTDLVFEPIDPVPDFNIAHLEPYANALEPYVQGLLPKRLFLQRCLRLKDADKPERTALPKKDPMRTVLITGLKQALQVAPEREAS